jgi:hypothetical protein
MADAPAAPKLELKMLALPVMLFASRKIDFKDPEIVKYSQITFITVTVLILTMHFYAYSRVTAKKNEKTIYVPPKAKPALPFGLGPPAEPVKPEDYTVTTLTDHETGLLKESAGSICMSMLITLFMSFKFNIHMSLVMQSVMLPLNSYDSIVLKKYILGIAKAADGGDKLYNEVYEAPTAESLAAVAAANGTQPGPVEPNEPRVEELPDEPEPKKEKSSPKKAKKTTTTAGNEID